MRRFALLAALLATPAASFACAMPTYDDVAIARALDEIDRPTPTPAPEAAVPAQVAPEAPAVNAPVVPVIQIAPTASVPEAPPMVAAKKSDS